jgi:hypothetical protein
MPKRPRKQQPNRPPAAPTVAAIAPATAKPTAATAGADPARPRPRRAAAPGTLPGTARPRWTGECHRRQFSLPGQCTMSVGIGLATGSITIRTLQPVSLICDPKTHGLQVCTHRWWYAILCHITCQCTTRSHATTQVGHRTIVTTRPSCNIVVLRVSQAVFDQTCGFPGEGVVWCGDIRHNTIFGFSNPETFGDILFPEYKFLKLYWGTHLYNFTIRKYY